MKINLSVRYLVFLLLTVFYLEASAQVTDEWMKTYGGEDSLGAYGWDVETDDDGFVYVTGGSYINQGIQLFLHKYNDQGDTIWTSIYASNDNARGRFIRFDSDGNIYVMGNILDSLDLKDFLTVKFNSSGVVQWAASYIGTDSLDDSPTDCRISANGNVYVTGSVGGYEVGLPNTIEYIATIKYDSNGVQQWIRTYRNPWDRNHDDGGRLILDADENVYISGHGSGNVPSNWGFITIKYDSLGVEEWSSTYTDASGGYNIGNVPGALRLDSLGNLYVFGFFNYNAPFDGEFLIIKYDLNGDTLWTIRNIASDNNNIHRDSQMDIILDENEILHIALSARPHTPVGIEYLEYNGNGNLLAEWTYEAAEFDKGSFTYGVQMDTAYNVYVTGINYKYPNNWDDSEILTLKISSEGERIWYSNLSWGYGYEIAFSLELSNDGNLYAAGMLSDALSFDNECMVIKFCQKCNTVISGKLYEDADNDCVKDSVEAGLSRWIVNAEPGSYYTTTDSLGNYSFLVPPGTYTVSAISDPFWVRTCPVPNYTVTLADSGDASLNNDFAHQKLTYCERLTVDMSSARLRPCMTSRYMISYCNDGTVTANGVYIEVTFDSSITSITSTLPWSSQNGYTYTFLVDTLDAATCGSFQISAEVSCSTTVGGTHCFSAEIFPEPSCFPDPISWDKSSVEVKGSCVDDSLACFWLFNTGDAGTGDMQDSSTYRIYVNNIMVSTGSFQINGGDSLQICWQADGNTIRLEADQNPGHPGNSRPRSHVELCGGPPDVLGLMNTVPEDDLDDQIEIVCHVVTAAFDPNDKSVLPIGITNSHYIDSTDRLEYTIRFQNTGTDTAFTVTIRDTLSAFLDPASVISGASSHEYDFRMYGQGILEWTFHNIYLPDSNVNEPLSHGHIKFKIDQAGGNSKGTVITNRVGIIFDFNDPVITNTTDNMVWDWDSVNLVTVSIPRSYVENIAIHIFPNPFTERTKVEINGKVGHNLSLTIYNQLGEIVQRVEPSNSNSFEIERGNLESGIYFYQVADQEKLLGSGKVVVQ